jgi:hypothetical protein
MSEHEIELDDLGLPPPWPNVGVMLGDLSRSLVHQRWHDAALAHLFNAGAISAGEVFRLTTHTCMGMQELVERWRHEIKLNFKSEVLTIRDLDPFDFIVFMEDAHTWLVDPARTLPVKGTVGSLLGDAYPAFLEQSEAWLESVLGFGEDELPGEGIIVISMLALVGVPSTWWGAPQWPEIVNEFLDALDDPNHQHWLDFDISPNTLPPQPAAMKTGVVSGNISSTVPGPSTPHPPTGCSSKPVSNSSSPFLNQQKRSSPKWNVNLPNSWTRSNLPNDRRDRMYSASVTEIQFEATESHPRTRFLHEPQGTSPPPSSRHHPGIVILSAAKNLVPASNPRGTRRLPCLLHASQLTQPGHFPNLIPHAVAQSPSFIAFDT